MIEYRGLVAVVGGGMFTSLSILLGQVSGSEAAAQVRDTQAFRHGILILTIPAVLFFTAVCLFAIRRLSRSVESEAESVSGEDVGPETRHT